MKIEHTQTREDGGGHMTVTATTPEEKHHLVKHFRLYGDDVLRIAQAPLTPGPLVHICPEGGRDNDAWFQTDSSLDLEFSAPYLKEYIKRTGDVGRGILPDVDLNAAHPWQGLRHTHYLRDMHTEHGHICFSAIVHARDWNKMTAAQYADKLALDYIQESVGNRYSEPEYISAGNLYRINPNYLKRHPAKPALSAQWLFSALCDHWLANVANDAQREIVEADRALMFANHRGEGNLRDIKAYGTRELRRSWDGPTMSWEELQNLAAVPV